jgi:hypothetical protein
MTSQIRLHLTVFILWIRLILPLANTSIDSFTLLHAPHAGLCLLRAPRQSYQAWLLAVMLFTSPTSVVGPLSWTASLGTLATTFSTCTTHFFSCSTARRPPRVLLSSRTLRVVAPTSTDPSTDATASCQQFAVVIICLSLRGQRQTWLQRNSAA